MARVHINITDRQQHILLALAERRQMPISGVVRIAVQRFLADIENAAEVTHIRTAQEALNAH